MATITLGNDTYRCGQSNCTQTTQSLEDLNQHRATAHGLPAIGASESVAWRMQSGIQAKIDTLPAEWRQIVTWWVRGKKDSEIVQLENVTRSHATYVIAEARRILGSDVVPWRRMPEAQTTLAQTRARRHVAAKASQPETPAPVGGAPRTEPEQAPGLRTLLRRAEELALELGMTLEQIRRRLD